MSEPSHLCGTCERKWKQRSPAIYCLNLEMLILPLTTESHSNPSISS